MCMCVPFLYSFVATFGWVWFPAFNLVFLLIKITHKQTQNLCYTQIVSEAISLVGKNSHFQSPR